MSELFNEQNIYEIVQNKRLHLEPMEEQNSQEGSMGKTKWGKKVEENPEKHEVVMQKIRDKYITNWKEKAKNTKK